MSCQGESVYREAQQELTAVSHDATRGFTDLRETIINRTRSLSLNTSAQPATTAEAGEASETTPTTTKDMSSEQAIQESETVLSRLRGEAAKRLKDLQKAEDAADEALLRFGSNLRDFLSDAIKIAPPTGGADEQGNNPVLFESKDAHGKRVIHTSRFDAQLHVIHTTSDNFMKDGAGDEYDAWTKDFDLDQISPLRLASKMTVPILIAHGTDDNTVPLAQSRRLHSALQSAGRPHEYVEYKDEGHGFEKAENATDFFTRVGAFLDKHNPP